MEQTASISRKGGRRLKFQINFDFSDDEEDIDEKENVLESTMLKLKAQLDKDTSKKLPLVCGAAQRNDAESFCVEESEDHLKLNSKENSNSVKCEIHTKQGKSTFNKLLNNVTNSKKDVKDCKGGRKYSTASDQCTDSQFMNADNQLSSSDTKQMTTSKSKFIFSLIHPSSLQDSAVEILASVSDGEADDDDDTDASLSSARDKDVDHISESDASLESEEHFKFNEGPQNLRIKRSGDGFDFAPRRSVEIPLITPLSSPSCSYQNSSMGKVHASFNDKEDSTSSTPSSKQHNIKHVLAAEYDGQSQKEPFECAQGLFKMKKYPSLDTSDRKAESFHLESDHGISKLLVNERKSDQDTTFSESASNEEQGGDSVITNESNTSDSQIEESVADSAASRMPLRTKDYMSSPGEQNFQMRTIIVPDVKEAFACGQESDSSDDDNFENFVSQVKKDIQDINEKLNSKQEEPSLDDFIVDDNDCEDTLDDWLSASEIGACNNDDDEVFYIRTNNIMSERDDESSGFRSLRATSTYPVRSISNGLDFGGRRQKDTSYSNDSHSMSDSEDLGNSIQSLRLSDETRESDGPWSKNSCDAPFLNKTTAGSFFPKSKRSGEYSHVMSDMILETPTRPKKLESSTKHKTKVLNTGDSERDQFKTPDRRMKAGFAHQMTAPRPILPGLKEERNVSFLKSLSTDCLDWKRHPEALRFVKGFNSLKQELTSRLFRIFNESVFESKLPETISLEWSTRYTKTAGTFSYSQRNSVAKITLSQKVCDSPERVRDTLAHELCHAAVKLINNVCESHGPFWKSWAKKTNKIFPFMPVVARCHDYKINTKFTYQCVNCKYRVGRHSKSLDTDRKVCGHCHGRFELFLTKDLNSSGSLESYTPRAPTKFASYVKEHYSEKKKKNLGMKHGDVMRLLSKEFALKNTISET